MNIYIRKNDDDLLKYLNEEEFEKIRSLRNLVEYGKNEQIFFFF